MIKLIALTVLIQVVCLIGPSNAFAFYSDPALMSARSSSGIFQFRGNPTHTFYGTGPITKKVPKVLWKYPEVAMGSTSSAYGKSKHWAGTGWTGQPGIWKRSDGITEVIVGAYDKAVHFIDFNTGKDTRPKFLTGDIIKGSVSIDPDGYPLLYFGSRDNYFRILALDRVTMPYDTWESDDLLWSMHAYDVSPTIWNNDWDANPSIINDILFEGGENSWFFIYKLNRSYQKGMVSVKPKRLVAMKGWTSELLKLVGDRMISIENSPAIYKDRVYFANGGGRIVGLDISDVENKVAPIVFDFWAGDDIDGSIVIDDEGMLYVPIEYEPKRSKTLKRKLEVGQIIKLNPYNKDNPLVWGRNLVPAGKENKDAGVWATPALGKKDPHTNKQYLYVPTQTGEFLALDTDDGRTVWQDRIGWHSWSSPNIVQDEKGVDHLLVATCSGTIRNYNLADPKSPKLLWKFRLKSKACIESTPAIWEGKIIVGARDGFIYAIGEDK
ncbi:MAG: PQQ-like beta-propeller repeat protein [Bacteriovoracaceae bacterium]|nr:PQQ-like beta-propeller repeat protein [Bacteriovoracaceae bacterium]